MFPNLGRRPYRQWRRWFQLHHPARHNHPLERLRTPFLICCGGFVVSMVTLSICCTIVA